MFENIKAIQPDPILGIIAAYSADPNPKKIDLGIGVYRDEQGNTPMLDCVVEAEKQLLATQTTKTYLGPKGVVGFNEAITELILGKDNAALRQGRVRTVQTPGGTGALRVAADLIKVASPEAELWASDPTWANHLALFPGAGVTLHDYPYYDARTSSLRFDDMVEALQQRGPGDLVLFHGCCHNPSGMDLSREQWQEIADIAKHIGFIPVIDMAYQGFGHSLDEDAYGLRLMADTVEEMILCSSCSKTPLHRC